MLALSLWSSLIGTTVIYAHVCVLYWLTGSSMLLTLFPSLILSSAGIGRTGTIVVVDMILETIDTMGKTHFKQIIKKVKIIPKKQKIHIYLFPLMTFFLTCFCRYRLWYWHPEIHPDGTRSALRHGADRSPVQVHLLSCVWVHPDHQGQGERLHGEEQTEKHRRDRNTPYIMRVFVLCLTYWVEQEHVNNNRHVLCVNKPLHFCPLLWTPETTSSMSAEWYVIGACARWPRDRRLHEPSPRLTFLCFSSPGSWDGVWKPATQTPASEQKGFKVSECVSVCLKWMSVIHSHGSSKPHIAALLSKDRT